jgi:hypothetical protein
MRLQGVARVWCNMREQRLFPRLSRHERQKTPILSLVSTVVGGLHLEGYGEKAVLF